MKILKRLLKILLGIVGAIALLIALLYLSDRVFWGRLLTFPGSKGVTAVDWYKPLEAVRGQPRDDLATVSPGSETVSAAALKQAIDYGTQTNSVALLVWHRGVLQLEHYWPGYGKETRTDPASMHKTVLGLLYGAAIQDGVIKGLDEPAATYLPEWRGDARARIKIRDLLQMSSGLEVITFSPNPLNEWWQLFLGHDITKVALSVPAIRDPGKKFEYSNFNSQALGIALQRATGKRYAQYLSERLWSRIGADTAYVWLDDDGGMPRTYCCLQTNARGWVRVGELILNQGKVGEDQVVPADWIAQMTTPAATNPNYGFQVWLGSPANGQRAYNSKSTVTVRHSEPFAAPDVVFLDGNGGQRLYVVPSAQLIIVRTGATRSDWDDARLPNAILRGIVPPAPDPAPNEQNQGGE